MPNVPTTLAPMYGLYLRSETLRDTLGVILDCLQTAAFPRPAQVSAVFHHAMGMEWNSTSTGSMRENDAVFWDAQRVGS